ncbi:suppressor of fused domain protein [Methylomonas sp. ZR1]|nr:suppressor of fused domain protein [Methylomonas sp. ZR1]
MAYNLLLVAGKMGDYPPLYYGHRVPLNLSDSINTMMFTQPSNFPGGFSIKSGRVDLLQVVGITSAELEFAKKASSDELKELIVSNAGGLFTSKDRVSVV